MGVKSAMICRLFIAAWLIAPLACLADEKFVVHEWGVLVRDSAGQLGGPDELINSLPAFVLRHDKSYVPKQVPLSWRKPIVYFYGADGLSVHVRIDAAMGKPLAYFPRPDSFVERNGQQLMNAQQMTNVAMTEAIGMEWTGTLTKMPEGLPQTVKAEHWWAMAREVPAMWINTKGGSEHFLFYEATARQDPTVVAEVGADSVVLRNTAAGNSGPVLLIVNDGKSRFMVQVDAIDGAKNVTLDKREITKAHASDKDILDACTTACRRFGLSAEETKALVESWKPDLLTHIGFLVISRLPREIYDKIFPLTITPKPSEVVRVGLIFDGLPGQDNRASWLPGLEQKLAELGEQLGADDFRVRAAANSALGGYGDIAQPFLEGLMSNKDPEVVRAAGILLERLKVKATTQPAPPAVIVVPRQG